MGISDLRDGTVWWVDEGAMQNGKQIKRKIKPHSSLNSPASTFVQLRKINNLSQYSKSVSPSDFVSTQSQNLSSRHANTHVPANSLRSLHSSAENLRPPPPPQRDPLSLFPNSLMSTAPPPPPPPPPIGMRPLMPSHSHLEIQLPDLPALFYDDQSQNLGQMAYDSISASGSSDMFDDTLLETLQSLEAALSSTVPDLPSIASESVINSTSSNVSHSKSWSSLTSAAVSSPHNLSSSFLPHNAFAFGSLTTALSSFSSTSPLTMSLVPASYGIVKNPVAGIVSSLDDDDEIEDFSNLDKPSKSAAQLLIEEHDRQHKAKVAQLAARYSAEVDSEWGI